MHCPCMECCAMLLNQILIYWRKACWPLLSKNNDYYWRCMTPSWSILVKLLVMMVNSNNYTELLKHCNEYGSLFLVPLWLWCLTMWVLAASTLSLTVRAEYCVCAMDSAAVLKQAFCTTSHLFVSLNHQNLSELRHQYLQQHWILNITMCQCYRWQ